MVLLLAGEMHANLQWNIVWSDEFNGTSINTNNWAFEVGNNKGWGNLELEYYTNTSQNAYVSGGCLHIVALQQTTTDDGGAYYFTSARLTSKGLYNTPTYGRIQWRAALPKGVGMWPALWMLGSDIDLVGWPACGEIDVVENKGTNTDSVQGTINYGTSSPPIRGTGHYNFPKGTSTADFHIYELDWTATTISWLVDGNVYETQSVGAPFNQPFYIIMNVAVGGRYVGEPSTNSASVGNIEAGTTFPQEMLVDYVRVLELTNELVITVTPSNAQEQYTNGPSILQRRPNLPQIILTLLLSSFNALPPLTQPPPLLPQITFTLLVDSLGTPQPPPPNGDFVLSWPTNIVCHLQTLTNSPAGGNWSDLSNAPNPFVVSPGNFRVFYRLESP